MLAIHDLRTSHACALINELTPSQLKPCRHPQQIAKIFLYALANKLESVCLLLLEKGFPENVNAPIFGGDSTKATLFRFPSYFLVSIAFGMDSITRAMIKVTMKFLKFSN